MKIIVFGDVVGRIGRQAVKLALTEWKLEHNPDLVIANVENISHGRGVSRATLEEMRAAGVDIFTSGNHIWANREVLDLFVEQGWKNILLRPQNMSKESPGIGAVLHTIGSKRILVINLMGRIFMNVQANDPFQTFDEVISKFKIEKPEIVLVDFHGEATSEKYAFAWHVADRVSLVWGTHTHVPTRDERILNNHCAYITDIGMTGFKNGILGIDKDAPINNFRTGMPAKHIVPESGLAEINAIMVEIESDGRAKSIQHIHKEFNI